MEQRRHRFLALSAAAAGLAILGSVGMAIAGLSLRTPWPIDPALFGHALQVEFLFGWSGFAALVVAALLIAAALRKPA